MGLQIRGQMRCYRTLTVVALFCTIFALGKFGVNQIFRAVCAPTRVTLGGTIFHHFLTKRGEPIK